MHSLPNVTTALTKWCEKSVEIAGAGIVGSYARGEASEHSDIDILVLTESIYHFLNEKSWLLKFECGPTTKIEQWGIVRTVRAWTIEEEEFEFNFAPLSWADVPVDRGTREVVQNGLLIVYDPRDSLKRLLNIINDA